MLIRKILDSRAHANYQLNFAEPLVPHRLLAFFWFPLLANGALSRSRFRHVLWIHIIVLPQFRAETYSAPVFMGQNTYSAHGAQSLVTPPNVDATKKKNETQSGPHAVPNARNEKETRSATNNKHTATQRNFNIRGIVSAMVVRAFL